MNYGPDWIYENPRNGFQDAWNRYYSWRHVGGAPPSALSRADSNRLKYDVSGFPIIGDAMRAHDYGEYLDHYMKARGLTWADVKYPSRIQGAGSNARFLSSFADVAIGAGFARSVLRLYR